MKSIKWTKMAALATLLVMTSSAQAEDFIKIGGGLLLSAGSIAYYLDERDSAQQKATNCAEAQARVTGFGYCEEEVGALPIAVGLVGGIGGVALAVDGITDDHGYHGISFGFTDSGNVGLQKKWEF